MSAMAAEYGALNLSQGFPNFEIDPLLSQLVNQAMNDGFNQYAPMPGHLALRERISEKVAAAHGKKYDPGTEITVTAGATQAIYTAISALVHSGDEVIVFAPAYDCYEPAIQLQGAISVPIQLKPPLYQVDWDEVRATITPKTSMIIINSPHNPSGMVFSEADMLELQDIAEHHDLLVLSDEVYEHIIFDDLTHQSAARFPELAKRSIITASFGKTFHATGWKMGYCLAPEPYMEEFRKVHQYLVFSVNHPVQRAMATYLETPAHYLTLGKFYQQKRDRFLSFVKDTPFKVIPSQGTYFQLLDYSAISKENDIDFARRLTIDHGLAAIPTSVFNENRENHFMLRFCFAKIDSTLEQAGNILKRLQAEISHHP